MRLFRPAPGPARPEPDRTWLTERGWVLPVGFGRPEVPLTRIGTVDSPLRSWVDPRGLVSVPLAAGGSWTLDWWIGADDRWHQPALEPGVRQRLVDASPVVESRLRIPGGDAIHRAFGVRADAFPGGDEHIVVEIENDTPVPFAVALVIRPFGVDGSPGDIDRIELAATTGGTGADTAQVVLLDGVPAMVLARRPARAAGATGWTEVADVVTSGEAPTELGTAATAVRGAGGATAALLVPVPHRATLRVVLPLGAAAAGGPTLPGYPGALPPFDRVASGWAVQSRRGVRAELPDTSLAEGIDASRRGLLIAATDAPADLALAAATVSALDREGFADEAARALATWPDALALQRVTPVTARAALAAVVGHWRLTRDQSLAEALLPEVSALDLAARKAGASRVAPTATEAAQAHAEREALADMLGGLGQADAARGVRADAARLRAEGERAPAVGSEEDQQARWAALRAATSTASGTWSWPGDEPGGPAFLAAVRELLVAVDGSGRGLCLLPAGFGPWWGQGVELHDAPTPFGRLSFAVRWHGERPAVLWELEPHPDVGEVVITATAVDPSWSTVERRGDGLWAPVARPSELEVDQPSAIPQGMGKAESVAPRSVLPLISSERADDAAPSGDDPPAAPDGSFT